MTPYSQASVVALGLGYTPHLIRPGWSGIRQYSHRLASSTMIERLLYSQARRVLRYIGVNSSYFFLRLPHLIIV